MNLLYIGENRFRELINIVFETINHYVLKIKNKSKYNENETKFPI